MRIWALGFVLLAGCGKEPPAVPQKPRFEPKLAWFEGVAKSYAETKQLAELEANLEAPEAATRADCARDLGDEQNPASAVPLLLRLKYETDVTARIAVARSLAMLGNLAGLEELRTRMATPDARAAGLAAIDVCRELGRTLGAQPTYVELIAAMRELEAGWHATGRAPGAQRPLNAGLRARLAARIVDLQGFALRPVDDARFVLMRSGEAAVPLLGEALRAAEVYLRSHTLEIVQRLARSASALIPQTRALLADPLTRNQAALALGELGATDAVPDLLAMLRSSDIEARTAAARAFGPLGDTSVRGELEALMHDAAEPYDVRVAAAFSVALFENQRPALRWLETCRDAGKYHRPTLDEMIDRIKRGH